MLDQIATCWKFVRTHSLKESLSWMNSKEAPGIIQFFKYGLCGGAATIFHQGIALGLSYSIIPAIDGMSIDGMLLDDETRSNNLLINNTIGSVFGILVAYITNVLWVFKGGRHSRLKEFILFFAVALFSFVCGLVVIAYLINQWGVHSLVAQLGFLITSVLVNYVCRKLFIFKG